MAGVGRAKTVRGEPLSGFPAEPLTSVAPELLAKHDPRFHLPLNLGAEPMRLERAQLGGQGDTDRVATFLVQLDVARLEPDGRAAILLGVEGEGDADYTGERSAGGVD